MNIDGLPIPWVADDHVRVRRTSFLLLILPLDLLGTCARQLPGEKRASHATGWDLPGSNGSPEPISSHPRLYVLPIGLLFRLGSSCALRGECHFG